MYIHTSWTIYTIRSSKVYSAGRLIVKNNSSRYWKSDIFLPGVITIELYSDSISIYMHRSDEKLTYHLGEITGRKCFLNELFINLTYSVNILKSPKSHKKWKENCFFCIGKKNIKYVSCYIILFHISPQVWRVLTRPFISNSGDRINLALTIGI